MKIAICDDREDDRSTLKALLWFKAHPQWSKSNKYAELEARIYI